MNHQVAIAVLTVFLLLAIVNNSNFQQLGGSVPVAPAPQAPAPPAPQAPAPPPQAPQAPPPVTSFIGDLKTGQKFNIIRTEQGQYTFIYPNGDYRTVMAMSMPVYTDFNKRTGKQTTYSTVTLKNARNKRPQYLYDNLTYLIQFPNDKMLIDYLRAHQNATLNSLIDAITQNKRWARQVKIIRHNKDAVVLGFQSRSTDPAYLFSTKQGEPVEFKKENWIMDDQYDNRGNIRPDYELRTREIKAGKAYDCTTPAGSEAFLRDLYVVPDAKGCDYASYN